MSIGIVGMPNVGKSTLFKLLTSNDIVIANYPFATIDPNVGVVPVPDERLDVLTKMSNSKKTIPAVVEFFDIAGLVKGASTGEGLGNQFLTHIRDVSAICQVVRCFPDSDVIHVDSSVDPIRDLETINAELTIKDLETIGKRLPKAEAEAKTGDKDATKEVAALQGAQDLLSAGKSIQHLADDPFIKRMLLLTTKPKFYLLNGEPEDVSAELKLRIKDEGSEYIIANVALADELPELIKKAYEILGLISFFTTGEDESRAWTIRKGSTAPQAAGAIHSDFEEKFIRAEVVSYEDFITTGSWPKARQQGKLRVEGKEYIIADGDIVEIRHG
ncbi:MAG: redox-regulated ATPase YchF [Candidatus Harrisonbacteria bacterium CG10_big_fil_rev_8_21_14_0_10_49_15]|uniref:Redox-regulated ATPase YchF n=1 Tax=Candidatus Harrisonbacteria bacterium CG10_big_fil_rev_8_21_14_0_10_49_15 TaxID=1974587 RepID=A0A2H0ULI0_9BACT|nr:MAG: redox-regulated ATPase YchF [Candidatus Harrisonbacteria bacterium CG10_big_fil_rev_8_21_14_0_10_49_15]